MSTEAVLEARNLTKVFGAFKANSDISIQFKSKTIYAVIGENGAGKSTLMKLLFGLYQPTSGEILVRGQQVHWRSPLDAISHGIGMVQQHFALVETMSVIDNIILGTEKRMKWQGVAFPILDRKAAIEHLENVLPSQSLRLDWHAAVEDLSVGQKQKVEILKLLYREAQVLILDEPTAVLTPQEIEDLFQILMKLRDEGCTIIIISHKLEEVFSLCDEYTVLRAGEAVDQGRVQETTKDQIIEKMIGKRVAPVVTQRNLPHEAVLTARGLSENGKGRLKSVNFQVRAGEVVGIAGVEGAGQANLVEALLGLRKTIGDLELFGKTLHGLTPFEIRKNGVGLIPQDRKEAGLWGEESCYHNLIIGLEEQFTHSGILQEAAIRRHATEWSEKFDVRASSLTVTARSLSGGNQQKLIIAREVEGRKPKLLICHQPTRGVDLGAVQKIHEALLNLRNEGLAILVISSDLDELITLSDRIVVLFEGETRAEFERDSFDAFQIGRAMTGVAHD